jgi:putative transposase
MPHTYEPLVRHNDYGDIQVFYCKECGKHFFMNAGFEGMKTRPQDITAAMQLYFSGLSFRNVTKALKLRGVKVSHVAVYKWINKYVSLMEQYIEKIQPNVSDTWRADEIWVRVKGDMKYVFAVMDDRTRRRNNQLLFLIQHFPLLTKPCVFFAAI